MIQAYGKHRVLQKILPCFIETNIATVQIPTKQHAPTTIMKYSVDVG